MTAAARAEPRIILLMSIFFCMVFLLVGDDFPRWPPNPRHQRCGAPFAACRYRSFLFNRGLDNRSGLLIFALAVALSLSPNCHGLSGTPLGELTEVTTHRQRDKELPFVDVINHWH